MNLDDQRVRSVPFIRAPAVGIGVGVVAWNTVRVGNRLGRIERPALDLDSICALETDLLGFGDRPLGEHVGVHFGEPPGSVLGPVGRVGRVVRVDFIGSVGFDREQVARMVPLASRENDLVPDVEPRYLALGGDRSNRSVRLPVSFARGPVLGPVVADRGRPERHSTLVGHEEVQLLVLGPPP